MGYAILTRKGLTMAKGPRGERRPDDPAAAAVRAVQIGLGEEPERLDRTVTNLHTVPDKEKSAAAIALGRLGGKRGGVARAQALSSDEKRRIAKKAADARWGKVREDDRKP